MQAKRGIMLKGFSAVLPRSSNLGAENSKTASSSKLSGAVKQLVTADFLVTAFLDEVLTVG